MFVGFLFVCFLSKFSFVFVFFVFAIISNLFF